MKTQFMFVFTKSTIKQEHAENFHKECMNLFTVFFKAINAKLWNITRLILGFDSVPSGVAKL